MKTNLRGKLDTIASVSKILLNQSFFKSIKGFSYNEKFYHFCKLHFEIFIDSQKIANINQFGSVHHFKFAQVNCNIDLNCLDSLVNCCPINKKISAARIVNQYKTIFINKNVSSINYCIAIIIVIDIMASIGIYQNNISSVKLIRSVILSLYQFGKVNVIDGQVHLHQSEFSQNDVAINDRLYDFICHICSHQVMKSLDFRSLQYAHNSRLSTR